MSLATATVAFQQGSDYLKQTRRLLGGRLGRFQPAEGSSETVAGKNLPYGGMRASSFEHNYSLSARIPDTTQRKQTPGAADTRRSIKHRRVKGGYKWPPPPYCLTGHAGEASRHQQQLQLFVGPKVAHFTYETSYETTGVKHRIPFVDPLSFTPPSQEPMTCKTHPVPVPDSQKHALTETIAELSEQPQTQVGVITFSAGCGVASKSTRAGREWKLLI
ncbi:hypothetical protein PanWU01x14_154020 [Parasponia andersonii]|uniref:Uncharacterized protein n=1 Tax=Parasponia andersonii TaxID=3476 RepID=A0A2P5CH94_PARAD|nr:hypothetical protein PanWU01x14_154020 [Parasponia andersonii]